MIDFKKLNSPEYMNLREQRINEENMRESLRLRTCAFTGHRPDKLGGYDWEVLSNHPVIGIMTYEIKRLVEMQGVNRFICGGALGVDQVAFEVCDELKRTIYPHLYLILAMPFEKQDANWFRYDDISRLHSQRARANELILVDELGHHAYTVSGVQPKIYHPGKMQKRNEWMVDNSKYLIAVHDGSGGGTSNCIHYFCRQSGLRDQMLIKIHPERLTIDVRY